MDLATATRDKYKALANRNTDEGWLRGLIDGYYIAELENDTGRIDPGWLHPSDMAQPCDRFLLFKFMGVPERYVRAHNPKTYRIFSNGDYVGYRYNAMFDAKGLHNPRHENHIQLGCEQVAEDKDLRMHGHMDEVIWSDFHEEPIGVEIKSKHHDAFTGMRQPDYSHGIQVQSYFLLTPLNHFYVLYECKNDQDVRTFKLEPDLPVIAVIRSRALSTMANAARQSIPEPTVPENGCRTCPFFYGCEMAEFANGCLKFDEYRLEHPKC